VFDKFEAALAHAMLSIPATKAFEIGSGFRGTEVPGSKHNDPFVLRPDGALGTSSNWSGGVQGGITNGEDIYFRYFQSRKVFSSSDPSLASDLNLLRQFLSPNRQPNTMVRQAASLREAGMTLALCRERFLS
jgi:chorismate synthase